jgi:apolipoprotein N-acyltransferase
MKRPRASQSKSHGGKSPPKHAGSRPGAPGEIGLLATVGISAVSLVPCCLIFAPNNQFYLAYVCLVPWIIALVLAKGTRSVAFAAFLLGFFFYLINARWLWPVIHPGWPGFTGGAALGWLAAVAMSGYLGLYFPLTAVFIRRLHRRYGWPLWAAVPLVWVGSEYLRGSVIGGFHWFLLAHSHYDILPMIQISDVFGAYGVSFVLALANGAVADAILDRMKRNPNAVSKLAWPGGLIATAAVVVSSCGYGFWRINQSGPTPGPALTVVQTDFLNSAYSANADQGKVFRANHDLIADIPNGSTDLIVLSESAMLYPINDEFLGLDPQFIADHPDSRLGSPNIKEAETLLKVCRYFRDRLSKLAVEKEAGLFVGTAAVELHHPSEKVRSGRFNSAMLFRRDGSVDPRWYSKIYLVIFGEYVPFRNGPLHAIYEALNRITPWGMPRECPRCKGEGRISRDGREVVCPTCQGELKIAYHYSIMHGKELVRYSLRAAPERVGKEYRFGAPICYEDVIPWICRKFVSPENGRKQVDFLVNISNDGWFNHSDELWQHLAVCAFRAVENRVGIARSVNTGVSAFIDSTGRIRHAQPPKTASATTSRVVVDSRISLYSRTGDWLAGACTLLWIVWAFDAVRSGWRQKRKRRQPQDK